MLEVSCSLVLAAALTEFFPLAKIVALQATKKCFFCDFTLPFAFDKEVIPLLEERMRVLVKKDLPFEFFEMAPSNAAAFLEHHGVPAVAQHVRHQGGFVKLVKLDRFAAQVFERPLKRTGEIKLFKLCRVDRVGSAIRLIGAFGASKEELKEGVQACKEVVNHLELAKEKQLYQDGIWLPQGEALKSRLIAYLLKLTQADPISTAALDTVSMGPFHAKYCLEKGRGCFETVKQPLEGIGADLLDAKIGVVDRVSFPLKTESIISFLQIIAQFFTIVPFKPRVVYVGKPAKRLEEALKAQGVKFTLERGERSRLEFRLTDSLGREWCGPRIWEEEKIVSLSFFYSLERFVGLLLENRMTFESK
jgi:threonyl-tRNA synthetase